VTPPLAFRSLGQQPIADCITLGIRSLPCGHVLCQSLLGGFQHRGVCQLLSHRFLLWFGVRSQLSLYSIQYFGNVNARLP
jgi:hypothetical protein